MTTGICDGGTPITKNIKKSRKGKERQNKNKEVQIMVTATEDHSGVGALGQGPCRGRVLDAEKVGYGIKQLDTKWAAPQGYYLLGRAGDT